MGVCAGLRCSASGEHPRYNLPRAKIDWKRGARLMSERRSPSEQRRLSVGASTTPGEVLVPHAAVDFSERHPDVELDVRIADTEETVSALKKREVEVAIVGRDVDDPDPQSRVLEQDELVLVVAASSELAGSELHAADLAGLPFVMREEGSATRRAAEEALAAAGQRPRVAMELVSRRCWAQTHLFATDAATRTLGHRASTGSRRIRTALPSLRGISPGGASSTGTERPNMFLSVSRTRAFSAASKEAG